MTITARIVKAVVTLPVLGTVSRNGKGEIVKSAERYRIHLYAAKPGMKNEKQTQTHLLVGVMDGSGYTTEHALRSEKVLLPDGRELIALRVASDGCPISWETLPLEVAPAFNPDDLFIVSGGQVFFDSALIQSGNNGTYKISSAVKDESSPDEVRAIVSRYLTGEASEYADEMVEELKALLGKTQQTKNLEELLSEHLSEHLRQHLNNEMRPGGLIHRLWRR